MRSKRRGWTLFCRVLVCGFGLFFAGGSLYHHLDQGRRWSSGLVVLGIIGIVFLILGLFTPAKAVEKIAESIDF